MYFDQHFIDLKMRPSVKYVFVFCVFLITLGLRFLILPVASGLAFLTFYPGIAIVALLGGLRPTFFYITLGALSGSYIFVPPHWSFHQTKTAPTLAFVIAATVILLVVHFYQSRTASQTQLLLDEVRAKQAMADELHLAMGRMRQQAMIFTITQEGVVITDPLGYIVDANPSFERITEYSRDEIIGKHIRIIKSEKHDTAFYQNMWRTILETGSWQGEIWNRRKSGEIYLDWIGISGVRDEAGKIINYVGTSVDISHMAHAQTELERLAHHDGLTDLPNRLMLVSRLEKAIERAKRYRRMGALLFIDLDHFKEVNDTLGHKAGDELLQLVSNRLKERLRETDTLARLGGDEFVLVLEEVAHSGSAALVAEQVIRQLQTPFPLSMGAEARIGGSVGIALFLDDGDHPDRLLERADQALYHAKIGGRGLYRFFDPSEAPGMKINDPITG